MGKADLQVPIEDIEADVEVSKFSAGPNVYSRLL
jgi:hypothetical protein